MRRRNLKLGIAVFVVLAGLGTALFLKTIYFVPVLMYHSIDNNDKTTKLSVSPKSFERQMEFLHKNHYNVVGLDKIASYLEKREKMPPRTVAITFDDGYYNNYEYAYPILKKYNLPATIFVILKNVGKPGWLGWEEIREMSNSGIITIGSHTVSHAWLLDAKPDVLEKEVRESKMILEENMGKRVGLFCYPLGAFDKKAELYVEDAGYTCAVTTNPPKKWPANDIYAIKRIKISRTSDSLFIFWFKTSGYYTFVKESKGGY